jgi:integrase/recombinase XerD
MPDHTSTISPLRQRLIDDMNPATPRPVARKLAPDTIRNYLREVVQFSVFCGVFPQRATGEDLRRYQVQLASTGASTAKINTAISALVFFFTGARCAGSSFSSTSSRSTNRKSCPLS